MKPSKGKNRPTKAQKTNQKWTAECGVRQILYDIGEDIGREGLIKTPERYIRAIHELTSGYRQNPRKILSTVFTEQYDEMVIVRDLKFWSLCEHHMLPFWGTAVVAYIPDGKVVGLSKVGRLVQCFARRLQVQEKMTHQIAHAMDDALKPKGVAVLIRATHSCMAMRGVRMPAKMVTSCLLGGMLKQEAREEFLRLATVR